MANRLVGALGSQWLAAGYVAGVSMLLVFVLGRVLGPEQFGAYSYVLSLASIYLIIQDGGFRTLLFREGTAASPAIRDARGRLLPMALGRVLAGTLLGLLLVAIVPLPYHWAVSAAVSCFALVAVSGFVSAVLKGEGRFAREAVWQILVRTLTAGAIVAVLAAGVREIGALFLAWGAAVGIALTLPMGRAAWRWPVFQLDRPVLRASIAFLTIEAATALYFRIDIVLLEHLGRNPAQVGEYAAAYRLVEGVILLTTPFAHICFRYLRLAWQRQEDFNRGFLAMLAGMLGIAAVVFGVGLAIGGDVVQWAFGAEYRGSAALFTLLLAALFFILPNYIVTQAMIALNKERTYAVVAVAAAGLNILGNFWLIPAYGARGAAIATLVTEAFLLLALGMAYFKYFERRGAGVGNESKAGGGT